MKSEEIIRRKVSEHEVLVYAVLKRNRHRWLSNEEIGELTPGVSMRTVRTHTSRFALSGFLEQMKVFPEYRFRLRDSQVNHGGELLRRIEGVLRVLGPNFVEDRLAIGAKGPEPDRCDRCGRVMAEEYFNSSVQGTDRRCG